MTLTDDLARAIEPFLRLAESELVATAWAAYYEPEDVQLSLASPYQRQPIPVEYFTELRRAWIDAKRGR